MQKSNVIIIGAGLVGLSTAYKLSLKFSKINIVVLEKEKDICLHQSGNNSGVVHTGIYYKPGSLKAKNCITGRQLLLSFCSENGIEVKNCGKIIVATDETQLTTLENIHRRASSNLVECALKSVEEFQEIEPSVSGIKALHVPQAGVVCFKKVARALFEKCKAQGVEFKKEEKVISMRQSGKQLAIQTDKDEYVADFLFNCAGLYSDHILKLTGVKPAVKIIPFRGEYYKLKSEASNLCRALIYPVPDPRFPFLGVHLTRRIDGTIECGPNAVLAFAREGYKKTDINFQELLESLSFSGFQKFAFKHLAYGVSEMQRSFFKSAFVKALQKLVPAVSAEILEPASAGVRAQAIDYQGQIVDDFLIHDTPNSLHVLNAPSPAATSCLSIGELLTEKASDRIQVL